MSPAFHSIPGARRDLLIFGDHASAFIPLELDSLGLSDEDLGRHIAVDIGTGALIRALCAQLDCPGHLAGVSRLVIDLNRDLSAPGLIASESDGTIIPGNQDLSAEDRLARIETYYTPYHEALAACLDALDKPFVLSVHSFTPHPRSGEARAVELGLLVKEDTQSAEQFAALATERGPRINEPYSAYDLNHTIDAIVSPRGLRHLAIEVRQDHIATQAQAEDYALWLAPKLAALLE